MRTLAALALLVSIALAGCSGGDNGSVSTTSPTPIAAAPTPTATPCAPDDLDMAPCPGTPAPVIHTPLPPPGAMADADVLKHIPPGLSVHDRKIVETVMRAQPIYGRSYVWWVYCRGKIFVFLGPVEPGEPAAKVMNDDPRGIDQGGDYINFHNCIDYPMPGA